MRRYVEWQIHFWHLKLRVISNVTGSSRGTNIKISKLLVSSGSNPEWIQPDSHSRLWTWAFMLQTIPANASYHSMSAMMTICTIQSFISLILSSKYTWDKLYIPIYKLHPFNSTLMSSVFEVNLCDEKLAAMRKFPPSNEVFLVDLGNDGFHRAVYSAVSQCYFSIFHILVSINFTKKIRSPLHTLVKEHKFTVLHWYWLYYGVSIWKRFWNDGAFQRSTTNVIPGYSM